MEQENNPKIKIKKKSEFSTFVGKIFSNDIKSTKDSIVDGVVVPEIKSFIKVVVTSVTDNILYGKTISSRYSNLPANYVSYTNYSQPQYRQQMPTKQQGPLPVGVANIKDITFTDRGDAEVVLAKMNDELNRYGTVSVLSFYDYIGQRNVDPNTYNWGWRNLSGAAVRRSGIEEYYIDFPQVEPLK